MHVCVCVCITLWQFVIKGVGHRWLNWFPLNSHKSKRQFDKTFCCLQLNFLHSKEITFSQVTQQRQRQRQQNQHLFRLFMWVGVRHALSRVAAQTGAPAVGSVVCDTCPLCILLPWRFSMLTQISKYIHISFIMLFALLSVVQRSYSCYKNMLNLAAKIINHYLLHSLYF